MQLSLNAAEQCCQLLEQLGWKWNEPRVVDWLKRVGERLENRPYEYSEGLPEHVYVSLAKFLDLRIKCEQLLKLLQHDWNSAVVARIEKKYRCSTGKLPLKGYQKLHDLLDEVWSEQFGGF